MSSSWNLPRAGNSQFRLLLNVTPHFFIKFISQVSIPMSNWLIEILVYVDISFNAASCISKKLTIPARHRYIYNKLFVQRELFSFSWREQNSHNFFYPACALTQPSDTLLTRGYSRPKIANTIIIGESLPVTHTQAAEIRRHHLNQKHHWVCCQSKKYWSKINDCEKRQQPIHGIW